MIDEVVEAWHTNQRINVLVLDAIGPEGMACTLSKRGGRTVARQFAHLHNVRGYQLEGRAKKLYEGFRTFETREEPTRAALKKALKDSAQRVEEWFRRAHAGEKGFRLFKRGLVQQLSYLVSHESHHRGNILLTLKQCGHNLDKSPRYGLWDWDRA